MNDAISLDQSERMLTQRIDSGEFCDMQDNEWLDGVRYAQREPRNES